MVLNHHKSYISLAAIDYVRLNGIILITIPPSSSHKLQPLDKAVYGPCKRAFNSSMDSWLRSKVMIYEILELVRKAQRTAITSRNIVSGFSSTGKSPCNTDVFNDGIFAPTSMTERSLESQDVNFLPSSSTIGFETNSELELQDTFRIMKLIL